MTLQRAIVILLAGVKGGCMPFKVLEMQATPNPNAKKFVLDRTISEVPLSFRSPDSTNGNLLAEQLLNLKGVTGLLILNDFVTISKSSEVRWADIISKAKRILAKAAPVA